MSNGEERESESFNENYQVLKRTADWLTQQKEPDIDQLVPKVEEAMKAYQTCKKRLDAVQATLSQYFEQDGSVAEEVPSRAGATPLSPPRRTPSASDPD